MGILSGDPKKQPLHYGEIASIWAYLLAAKSNYATYQTFLNHCGDQDLKKQLDDGISLIKQESERIEEILKVNGIALPPSPPERSYATLEDIPVGARFNDAEISAAISANIAKCLVACSTIIGQSTNAQISTRLLRLNKDKGWLVTPPLHTNIPTKQ